MTGEIDYITRMCQYSGSVKAGDPEISVIWDTGSTPAVDALDEILKGLEQLGYRVTKILDLDNPTTHPEDGGADWPLYYLRLGEEGPFEVDVRELREPHTSVGNEVLVRVRLAKSPC